MTTSLDDSNREVGKKGLNLGDGFVVIGMFINPLGGIVAYVFPSMIIPALCLLLFYNFVVPTVSPRRSGWKSKKRFNFRITCKVFTDKHFTFF